ncbi:MAG TPA: NAD(P)/FAD-dependent oxidoreductase [Solirubrobacteraceae bacterium]|nr:NAD(P)/FAD-dependent oxidoreductase [Solirubrobacteraceae bacterium]
MSEHDVVIIGSGFSGLGMAIRLKEAGMDDFVVLERGADVGGTWHFNTYPGCACDVPSHLYSFSFAPNPHWTQTYSPQAEIGAYLKRCADDFGVRPHVRLSTTVTDAAYDEDRQRWTVESSNGTFTGRVLIAAQGGLAEPKIPEIPGIDGFEGETWHSARWNHDYDLRGKRVAAIGTGASAIQFVPAIQPDVASLHVVQRTPPWIMRHTNRPTTRFERRLYAALPAAQKAVRGGVYAGRELLVPAFTREPRLMKLVERLALRHMRSQLAGRPDLVEKVTPDYTIGCKRILPSNHWYPALKQPNVELLTGGIAEIRPNAIVAGDGSVREVDAIVFGTGFQVADMPVGRFVRGRGGRSLDEVWRGSPKAYNGTAVAGFPNLFLMTGPNTGLGHSSMVYMIESQIAHVMTALRTMRARGAGTIEVRQEAQDAYNAEIDARMDRTVWSTGCASWYIDATGRNATLWPDWTWRFRRRLAEFPAADYRLEPPVPAREPQLVPA